MRAREVLLEGRDVYLTLPRRKLTHEEIEILTDFQEVLRLLSDFYSTGRDQITFQSLHTVLKRYHNRPFMRAVNAWAAKVEAHHRDIAHGKFEAPALTRQIDDVVAHGMAAAKSGNVKAFIALGKHAAHINATLDKAFADPSLYYDNIKFSPLYVQDPLFFQTNNFLRRFEEDEMKRVIDIDPYHVFTYMNAPLDDNFQYLAYWSMELTHEADSVSLTPTQYNKWLRVNFRTDPAFNQLLKLVDGYLQNNEKHHLAKIIELMKQFPVLKETHDDIISHVTQVYRGVPFNEDEPVSIKKILQHDKDRQIVAASEHRQVASNFAQSKGHMERYGRTDGVIITYGVTADDILLDTSVFGSIYSEAEIVINAATAKVLGTQTVYTKRDEDEGW